ncbi:hypothetical protein IAT38_003135 [Cryptococcus sp. DSM 104549]
MLAWLLQSAKDMVTSVFWDCTITEEEVPHFISATANPPDAAFSGRLRKDRPIIQYRTAGLGDPAWYEKFSVRILEGVDEHLKMLRFMASISNTILSSQDARLVALYQVEHGMGGGRLARMGYTRNGKPVETRENGRVVEGEVCVADAVSAVNATDAMDAGVAYGPEVTAAVEATKQPVFDWQLHLAKHSHSVEPPCQDTHPSGKSAPESLVQGKQDGDLQCCENGFIQGKPTTSKLQGGLRDDEEPQANVGNPRADEHGQVYGVEEATQSTTRTELEQVVTLADALYNCDGRGDEKVNIEPSEIISQSETAVKQLGEYEDHGIEEGSRAVEAADNRGRSAEQVKASLRPVEAGSDEPLQVDVSSVSLMTGIACSEATPLPSFGQSMDALGHDMPALCHRSSSALPFATKLYKQMSALSEDTPSPTHSHALPNTIHVHSPSPLALQLSTQTSSATLAHTTSYAPSVVPSPAVPAEADNQSTEEILKNDERSGYQLMHPVYPKLLCKARK